jgi:hypothetical protein
MNVFNRIIVILLLFAIIVLAAVYIIAPGESLRLVSVTTDWLHQGTVSYIQSDRLLFAGGRVLIGGALIILCLILLWLEMRRPRRKSIRAQKVEGGEARITIESVEQRLAYNIDQLPDVIKVTPRVTGKSRGVDIDLVLETSPEVDIPMKTEEVLEVTREVIVERMGLKLGKVQIKIKHAPYPNE